MTVHVPTAKRVEVIGACTLYLGDCLEIMPHLGKVDAVVTDPPYGIGFSYEGYDDTRENLSNLISSVVPWSIENSGRSIFMCGITQTHVYPEPDWIAAITWDTTGSFGKCGYTQWMPVLFYGQDVKAFGNVEGIVTKSDVFRLTGGAGVGFQRNEKIDHPCPKPENLMRWAVRRFSTTGELIFDPFMGSGTTGVACVKAGRSFIGIEQHEPYFDIACDRIRKAYAQPDMFISQPAPKPVQEELL